MEESSFDIDPAQLAETSLLFPAHRRDGSALAPRAHAPTVVPGDEFSCHAWDEGGAL